jgi:dCMP deaminase
MTDQDFLRIALRVAAEGSEDPSTQTAAILVRRSGRRVEGCLWAANRFPVGVRPAIGPAKHDRIEHAERAVIYEAAAAGWATRGCVMYAPWFACCDCARAIVAAGVVEVVGVATLREATPERWSRAVAAGETILREAGVGMRWCCDALGVRILFDGREVRL